MSTTDSLEVDGSLVALQKFAKLLDNTVSDLDRAIRHLQTLEDELGGEEGSLKKFGGLVKQQAESGDVDRQGLAEVASESENLERAVAKVNGDLESELSELKEIFDDLEELHEKAPLAENALENLRDKAS